LSLDTLSGAFSVWRRADEIAFYFETSWGNIQRVSEVDILSNAYFSMLCIALIKHFYRLLLHSMRNNTSIPDWQRPLKTQEIIQRRFAPGYGRIQCNHVGLHVYPRSRGRVLRHLGQALESATEILVTHRLGDFRTYWQEHGQRGRASARPYPRRWTVKSRRSR